MQRQAEQLERLRLDFGQEKNVVIGGDTAHPASHWREGIMADGSDDDDVGMFSVGGGGSANTSATFSMWSFFFFGGRGG